MQRLGMTDSDSELHRRKDAPTLKIGVIGYGYWGPNVVRNFYNTPGATVSAVCDFSAAALQRVRKTYPSMEVTNDPDDILTSPRIDAVAIVTPISHHFPLAKKALENGKHVFVEKPFTATSAQAEELIELAARNIVAVLSGQPPLTEVTCQKP